MKVFNGKQYLAIAIANHKGLDKLKWEERIQWVKDNYNNLEGLEPEDNKSKFLYRKAVKALRDSDKNIPIQYIMDLDACNSGVQLMGVLGKCSTSCYNSNVIGQERNDVYGKILDSIHGVTITRDQVKKAAIPALYGSRAAPRNLFGEGSPELIAFNEALDEAVPSLKFFKLLGQELWNSDKDYHKWTLPDGHVAYCPTLVNKKERVELEDTSFTFEYKTKEPDNNHIPLIVNVIHSYDAYVMRELLRRTNKIGITVAHIHDSLWSQPANFNHIRRIYRDILMELAKSDELNRISKEINPNFGGIEYSTEELNLWKDIMDSEYAIS